jgi:hypothetical protein
MGNFGLRGRLKINGVRVAIASFDLEAPAAALGFSLKAKLADPTFSVGENDAVRFDIGVGVTTPVWVKMFDTGALRGIEKRIIFRGDSLTVDAINPLADKLKYAPRTPVYFYNPSLIAVDTTSVESDLFDADGHIIYPVWMTDATLSLYRLLRYVYIEKLGFARFVTNIENYQISRADFDVGQSYHDAVWRFVALLEPMIFAADDSLLYILDRRANIPAGLLTGARQMKRKQLTQTTKTIAPRQKINALILTTRKFYTPFNGDGLPPGTTERVESDYQEIGSLLAHTYQQTRIERHIYEFHEDPLNVTRITREVLFKVITEISAFANGLVRVTSREEQTDSYGYGFRLLIGSNKSLSLYCALPGSGSKLLRPVESEVMTQVWAQTANPGEYVKRWTQTQVTGLVQIEGSGSDQVKTAYAEVVRSNEVPTDATGITVINSGLSSETIRWLEVGPDQVQIIRQKVDQLTGVPSSNVSQAHVGSIRVGVPNTKQLAHRTLHRLPASDPNSDENIGPRVPASLDAGELPFATAQSLVPRILGAQANDNDTYECELVGFDAAIRRGSLRRVLMRDGVPMPAIITGYRISGRDLGVPGKHRVAQAVSLVKING